MCSLEVRGWAVAWRKKNHGWEIVIRMDWWCNAKWKRELFGC